jgi:hypothetical protein
MMVWGECCAQILTAVIPGLLPGPIHELVVAIDDCGGSAKAS